MSDMALSISQAVERLSRCDPTLKLIYLFDNQLADSGLAELVDCLLAQPDVVKNVCIGNNQLTDETGVKLARYLAASSTVQTLNVLYNELGSGTYLALAAALRVNSSLQYLLLFNNKAVDRTHIDAAFIEALRLNPDRSARSGWYLYSDSNEFERLRAAADELGHPSLQLLLAVLC